MTKIKAVLVEKEECGIRYIKRMFRFPRKLKKKLKRQGVWKFLA